VLLDLTGTRPFITRKTAALVLLEAPRGYLMELELFKAKSREVFFEKILDSSPNTVWIERKSKDPFPLGVMPFDSDSVEREWD